MKIAFAGAHCTGKTTLLNELKKIYGSRIFAITEVARIVISKGFPLGMDANIDSYTNYIVEQLEMEEKAKKYANVVSDRTILDTYVYSLVNKILPRPYIPEYFIKMLKKIWLLEKSFYDLYVYFPIEFDLELDNTRSADLKYRIDIDKQMKIVLDNELISYITVSGSVPDRLEIIKKYIEI